MGQWLSAYVRELTQALENMTVTGLNGEEINREDGIVHFTENAKRIQDAKGILFFAGNGASASMAEHMSHDFFQNGGFLTMTSSETAHITAIANDLSFENIFAYKIEKALSEKDALITISSSGNSPNVVKAIQVAREKGMFIITLSGMKPNNQSRNMGDLNYYIPANTYGMVEAAHAVLLHCLLDSFLERYMGGSH